MLRVDFKETANRMHALIESDTELYQSKEKEWALHLSSLQRQDIRICISHSNLPPIKKLNSQINPKNKEQEKFLDELRATDLKTNYRLPYVYGKPGSGKSYLSIRFAYKMIHTGIRSLFFVCLSEFLIKFKDFNDETKIDSLLTPQVLIMDDFCSHNITKCTIELLHAVIDHRLRHQKPTLVTSNIPPNKIAEFMYKSGRRSDVSEVMCEAIEDRMFELCSISNIKSDSIRIEKALDRMKENKR